MDCSLQFKPPIFFNVVQVWRLRWPLQNVDFVVNEPFLCEFWLVLGLFSYWKIYMWPSFSLLAEANRFLSKMSWYLVKFLTPLAFNKDQWKQYSPIPYFTVSMGSFSTYASVFQHKTHHWCAWPKSSIFLLSDHGTGSNSSANVVYQTTRSMVRWYENRALWPHIPVVGWVLKKTEAYAENNLIPTVRCGGASKSTKKWLIDIFQWPSVSKLVPHWKLVVWIEEGSS